MRVIVPELAMVFQFQYRFEEMPDRIVPEFRKRSAMSRLATLAHRFTEIRSFQTRNAGHNIQPIVGPDSQDANIGVH